MLLEIFPIFGLTAFFLLWTHTIVGAFHPWLHRRWARLTDFYIYWSALIIFFSIILHPLLLLIAVKFSFTNIFKLYVAKYLWLGIIGWLLLIIYDIAKPFLKHNYIARNWEKILIISNIGFVFTFFHSFYIEEDFRSGLGHWGWLFLGVTAIVSLIWTYGIKRLR